MQKLHINTIHNIKLFIGSIAVVFLVLFGWNMFYPHYYFALVFPLTLLAVIAWSLIEIKIHKKLCFKNCYFKETSFLAKFLTSKTITTVIYLLSSVVITTSIMHSIIDYSILIWGYIVIHVAIIIIIFKQLNNLFSNTIYEKYLFLFSREMTINISALLLLSMYIYIALNGYEPTYLRETLEQTQIAATNSIHSQVGIVNYALRVKNELDSLFWWSVIYASDNSSNIFFKYSIWIGFITINGLAIFGINRFIVQVVYGLNIIFQTEKENA